MCTSTKGGVFLNLNPLDIHFFFILTTIFRLRRYFILSAVSKCDTMDRVSPLQNLFHKKNVCFSPKQKQNQFNCTLTSSETPTTPPPTNLTLLKFYWPASIDSYPILSLSIHSKICTGHMTSSGKFLVNVFTTLYTKKNLKHLEVL